jgi:uncharacterized protein YacL
MFGIIIRVVLVVSAALVGLQIALYSYPEEMYAPIWGGLIGAGIGLFVIGLERSLVRFSVRSITYGAFGLIVGLIISNLVTPSIISTFRISWNLQLVLTIVFAYLGTAFAISRQNELNMLFFRKDAKKGATGCPIKLLDTSVIIDGRISDIIATGFLEGALVIPRFVLKELQHIADSSDSLKRNRGRRGLDILNRIQKIDHTEIRIDETDFPEVMDVDAKLIKLAAEQKATVVTNDFNLNKVAEIQGIPVLNINDLANAVKPIVLPGEFMSVRVLKEGKEYDQGVGYLDDGTMVVVDHGRDKIGQLLDVVVTSVLQTAAGRMIFTRLREKGEEFE